MIPQGKIGYVYSRDGDPLQPSQTLARVVPCNYFQDARTFLIGSEAAGRGQRHLDRLRCHESNDAGRTYLEWEGIFEGKRIAGITVLTRDGMGLIESIRLYHRPYDQVIAFSAELASRLGGH